MKITLWKDLPPERRIDDAWMDDHPMAYNWPKRRAKLEAAIERISAGVGCLAAVSWFYTADRLKPCQVGPAEGEDFCVVHGGPKKPPPITQVLKRTCIICGRRTECRVYPCDRCKNELMWFEHNFTRPVAR